MENIQLPSKIEFQELGNNKYQVVMEPLYPGYGVTLGNALRRILLSSLPGAAVVAVKIKGVDHEFSTVLGIKEDVIEIILNLKQMRIKVHNAEQVRLLLKVKGEKDVVAGDFKTSSDVEIMNPDLHLATLDGKTGEFEMEVVVQQGRGYVPVEQRENEKLEIGLIAVDAIYTPVRTVNFDIKAVRVGQITSFDQLTINLETDGTVDGKSAIDQSARILMDHFNLLMAEHLNPPVVAEIPAAVEASETPVGASSEEVLMTPGDDDLKSLGLSNRSYNALVKNNIMKISDLQSLSREQLENMEGLGGKSVEEIEKLLATYSGK